MLMERNKGKNKNTESSNSRVSEFFYDVFIFIFIFLFCFYFYFDTFVFGCDSPGGTMLASTINTLVCMVYGSKDVRRDAVQDAQKNERAEQCTTE